MLYWVAVFCVIALVAAALGLGGLAGTSIGIAQILLAVFLVLAALAMAGRALRCCVAGESLEGHWAVLVMMDLR